MCLSPHPQPAAAITIPMATDATGLLMPRGYRTMSPMKTRLLALLVLVAFSAPAAADDPHAEVMAAADRIAGEVSKLRGLKIKRPIKRGVMNRQQLEARLLQRVREDYKPEELADEEM